MSRKRCHYFEPRMLGAQPWTSAERNAAGLQRVIIHMNDPRDLDRACRLELDRKTAIALRDGLTARIAWLDEQTARESGERCNNALDYGPNTTRCKLTPGHAGPHTDGPRCWS